MPFVTGNAGTPTPGFSPASVSGCALWLDAADSSTYTNTGGIISSWKDKVVGTTTTAQLGSGPTLSSINGLSALYFNAGSNIMAINVTQSTTNRTFFMVFNTASNTGAYIWPSSSSGWEIQANTSNTLVLSDQNVAYVQYSGIIPLASPLLISITYAGNTNTQFNVNGTGPGTYANQNGRSFLSTDNTHYIGGNLSGYASSFYLGEIIEYNSSLTVAQVQQVEGYLAQKWGLTASLPSGHPGLTTNYMATPLPVFRLTPLPGNRRPFYITTNPFVPPLTLSVLPDARYSFLTAPSGTITNTGSSGSIGTATISSATYTSTAPSYITFVRGTGYILAPSITGIRTLILILRVTNASAPAYLLDARTGLGGGWLYSSTGTDHIGTDWTSATYYRDTVNTTFSGNFILALQDSTWHHICLQRASFTSAITFLARISQNETLGCDCGEIMIFTGALTAQQVKDNYNFFSSRFGWTPV